MPSIWYIILMVAMIIIMRILMIITTAKKKIFKKRTIWYTITTLIVFALSGLLCIYLVKTIKDMFPVYIGFLILICLLGLLHVYLLYRINPWSRRDQFLSEFLFTIFLAFIGAFTFILIFNFFDLPGYNKFLMSAYIFFPLAFLVMKASDLWLLIPEKKYLCWFPKLDEDAPYIEASLEFSELQFLIPADTKSSELIQKGIRAPLEMTIGEIFHYILFRHNVEENSKIQIQLKAGESLDTLFGWLFLVQKGIFKTNQVLDPNIKIQETSVRKGDTIFAKRC